MKLFYLLILSLLFQSCSGQTKKINGISFVASREPINSTHTDPVVNINANYAAIMPFGFIRNLEHPEIVFNSSNQWFGETKAGVKQYAEELQKRNIKIMLKPQIWVGHGKFTGYIEMKNEANWKILEDSYSKFILEFAKLAVEVNADIFCIGTELEKFITNRPDYWENLIIEIKKIYSGKLTYAANWDEFKRTPFWSDLDFIGIDAYFPVSDKQTPTIADCKIAWQEHKAVLKNYFTTYKKPILFTEFGYRSVDYSGKEPWKSDRSMTEVNLEAQTNTTQALFDEVWQEDWFAGGFVWKWFHNHSTSGGEHNARFTPQNKPVETLIKEHFASH